MKDKPAAAEPASAPVVSDSVLDDILAVQFLVAWAGEARSKPRRFGWWDTDLVDEDGGGDLLARLAPRTHKWAALEAVREAARRVDTKARAKHGQPDRMRTLFFLGFELDERLGDRLSALKRAGRPPAEALPLPLPLDGNFPEDKVLQALSAGGPVSFDKVPPVGRQLKGPAPVAPADLVRRLAAALVPPSPEYPFPFQSIGS